MVKHEQLSLVALVTASSAVLMLSGCGGSDAPTTSSGPTTTPGPTTTATTTTTNCMGGLCDCTIADVRPDAESLARPSATSEADCCNLCDQDGTCVSWQFTAGQGHCEVTLNNATWAGLINSTEHTFGTKNVSTCTDCDESECTEVTSGLPHMHRTCSLCARGSNWNQWPCFVPNACGCNGQPVVYTTTTQSTSKQPTTTAQSTSKPPTTTTPSEGPVVGDCTASDEHAITAMASTGKNSFWASMSTCWHDATGFLGNFDTDKFENCLQEQVVLTSNCRPCFSLMGQYYAESCKFDCLGAGSWCSSGCTKCMADARKDLDTCAEFDMPMIAPCLSELVTL